MTLQTEFNSGYNGQKKKKKKSGDLVSGTSDFDAMKAKASKKKKIDKRIQLL